MLSKVVKIQYLTVASEIESLLLEANLIKKYNPPYNSRLTDGKAYPLIKISIKDEYPKILFARRIEDKSLYFGPYPNVSAMKLVLKTIRRVFPYISLNTHPKTFCFYHHLGLCPCPSVIGTKEAKAEYKKTIHRIVKFLEGEMHTVVKDLEKERDECIKREEFEKAADMQKKIDAIRLITQPVHQPFEYEDNPSLKEDIRKKELEDLRFILKNAGVFTDFLVRIECYDISNTAGTNATGSLVVFTNGEKDSTWYRRFRITKHIKGPNDFAMMESVLSRRLKHTEWPYPQLFIVDGGKGQITSALKALQEAEVTIPLVGLAKREETIITSEFKEISLPKRSPALQMVMRIRDEAHRFAITYHKKLRSKITFE